MSGEEAFDAAIALDVVRSHVARLVELGMTYTAIDRAAGVARNTTSVAMSGRDEFMRVDIANALLMVDVDTRIEVRWQDRGECRTDTARSLAAALGVERVDDLFFPPEWAEGDAAMTERFEEAADALCARCPVRDDCLKFAVEHNVAGRWAGTSERRRARMRSGTNEGEAG